MNHILTMLFFKIVFCVEEFDYNYNNWDEDTFTDFYGITELKSTTSVPTQKTLKTTTRSRYNPKVDEILLAQKKLKSGLFTASLTVLFKTIAEKKAAEMLPLVVAFSVELTKLNGLKVFHNLGPLVPQAVQLMSTALSEAAVDAIARADWARFVVEQRKTHMDPETNAILDVADLIFNQADAANAAAVLRDIQNFPETEHTDLEIAKKAIKAFVLKPWKRVAGTESEGFLKIEINNYLEQIFEAQTPSIS